MPEEIEPTTLTSRFEQALVFALRLHARQVRKGTRIPYVSHLLAVASLVLEDGGDEDEAVAALLHDAVEDQGGRATLEDIRRIFGQRVAGIVAACSDTDAQPKPPWRERKERYLEHLRHAPPEVRRVSAADKVHNARSILRDVRADGEAIWDRFSARKDGTLWYYRSLAVVFAETGGGYLVDELRRVVDDIERVSG